MAGLAQLLRRTWRQTQTHIATIALCLAGLGTLIAAPVSTAEPVPSPDRVRGFFCDEKTDSINFLMYQAKGENEEMAANAVNKEIARASCAYYLPAEAIYTGEHTVMRDGLVFKLHSYVFLPEKVERWSGSVLGSLQQSPYAKHDV